MIWGTFFFIIFIIADAFIASEMESIAQSKGCESPRNYFWISLIFGLPGWIMVAALPNRNIERQLEQLNRTLASAQNQTGNAKAAHESDIPLHIAPPAGDMPDASKQIASFLTQAAKCARIADIQKLWESYSEDPSNTAVAISSKISNAALIERMYGSNPDKVQRLLNEITEISQNNP